MGWQWQLEWDDFFSSCSCADFFQSISNSRKKKLSRFVLTFLNPRKNSCTSPLNFTNFKTSLHLSIILRFLMERNRLRRSVSTILNPSLKAGKFVWITSNILNYLSYICAFAWIEFSNYEKFQRLFRLLWIQETISRPYFLGNRQFCQGRRAFLLLSGVGKIRLREFITYIFIIYLLQFSPNHKIITLN